MNTKVTIVTFAGILLLGISALTRAEEKTRDTISVPEVLLMNHFKAHHVHAEENNGQHARRNNEHFKDMDMAPGTSQYRLRVMWGLVEFLDMNEETAASFFPVLRDHSKNRDSITKKHRELAKQIIDDIEKEDMSTSALKEMVVRLESLQDQIEQEQQSFLAKSKKILNDRQYIKLTIFNDKLKHDLFNRYSSRRKGDSTSGPGKRGMSLEKRSADELQEIKKGLDIRVKEIEKQKKVIEKLLKAK
ncbi:hypothetical protein ACFL47_03100 [Candidatus Latescibacterota bacterium]